MQKFVALRLKTHLTFLQGPFQPFTAIHADLDVVGEPRLQANVHEAELRVVEIEIEVFAVRGVVAQLRETACRTEMRLERDPGFHA